MEKLMDNLISLIYRVALNVLPCQELLEGVRRLLDADFTALVVPGQTPVVVPADTAEPAPREMTAEQAIASPALQNALRATRERVYFAEAAPNPLPWHRLAIAMDADEADAGFVVCLRPAHRRPFDAQARQLGERLNRHFAAARALARQLMPQRVSHQMLNRLHFAFLCVDDAGQLLCCDEQMNAVLSDGRSLHLGTGGLATPSPAETRQLRQLLRDALAPTGAQSGFLQINVPGESVPLNALVMPAEGSGFSLPAGRTAAWVILCNQDGLQEEQLAIQAKTYGLTEAEARLVRQLLKGLNVQGCAEALEVSPNTVRWHLKRVFQKTGVTSQTELIRVLLACPVFSIRQK